MVWALVQFRSALLGVGFTEQHDKSSPPLLFLISFCFCLRPSDTARFAMSLLDDLLQKQRQRQRFCVYCVMHPAHHVPVVSAGPDPSPPRSPLLPPPWRLTWGAPSAHGPCPLRPSSSVPSWESPQPALPSGQRWTSADGRRVQGE